MRRSFIEFVSGFFIVALFCVYLLRGSAVFLIIAFAAAALLSLAALRLFHLKRLYPVVKTICAAALGALACAVVFQLKTADIDNAALGLDSSLEERHAVVSDFPQDYGGSQSVRVRLLDREGNGVCSALIYYYDGSALSPGDIISADMKLSRSDTESLYLLTKGIYITGTVSGGITILREGSPSFSNLHVYIRNAAYNGTDRLFGEKAYFIRALLFGDKSGFDDSFFVKTSDIGVSHIFAVSGMNLSFLVTVIMILGRRKRPVYAAAIAGVLLFMAVTGFTASVVRAGIMQIATLAAFLFRRESESYSSLALSLLVLLGFNPYAAADIGLQFSFASVIGILTVGKKLDAYLRGKIKTENKLARRVLGSVFSMAAITISAQLSTIPLTVIYFRRISLVAVFSNLLIFWAVSAAFVLSVAALLLSAVWFWLGSPAAFVAGLLVTYMETCIDLLARVPFAVLGTGAGITVLWVVFCYLTSFLIYLRKPKRAFLKAAGLVLSSLALTLAVTTAGLYATFEVRALSVGNGQCIVITKGGKTVVVDCDSRSGSKAASALIESLKERNISKIDLLVLTSLHTENTSGAAAILQSVDVERFALPFYSGDRAFAKSLEAAADNRGTEVTRVSSDRVFKLGDMAISLFMPPSGGEGRGSAAVLAQSGGAAVLILGELDTDSQTYMAATREIPELFAVAAGRNGAKNATSPEILEKFHAKYVIISVGRNAYGIPDEETLSGMTAFGAGVLRTDIDGDIRLLFKNGRVSVR